MTDATQACRKLLGSSCRYFVHSLNFIFASVKIGIKIVEISKVDILCG